MTTTTVHAPVEISRRRLAGLLAVVTAATAAVTWTVTTTANDNADQPARSATATRQSEALGYPLGVNLTAAADAAETASAAPIVVAYHGAGFLVCANGEQPIAVADAYHGTGTTVCP
jgi:hypothetical protein